MGLGWKNAFGKGLGRDTITSGIEGAWTANPIQWDNGYFEMLLEHDWELSKSPSGAHQWRPIGLDEKSKAIDVDNGKNLVEPMMTTADIALIKDPLYKKISENFHKNPQLLQDSFAKAWFKLLHRDMGPKQRYLGPEVPDEDLIWQDPIPKNDVKFDIALAKDLIKKSSLSIIQMIETAWSSASTFRCTDLRGGANGARIALSPQNNWESNEPSRLSKTLDVLKPIADEFGASLADTIILAGKEYGCGSSRDWAAKGPKLLGVKAVIAESFERIHRSNLVGMGILPLKFKDGENAQSIGLTGFEEYKISNIDNGNAKSVNIAAINSKGESIEFEAEVCIFTPQEIEYFKNGGILPYVLKQLAA